MKLIIFLKEKAAFFENEGKKEAWRDGISWLPKFRDELEKAMF